MTDDDKSKNSGQSIAIIVALIGLLGTLGAALIGNWDKILPNNPTVTSPSPGDDKEFEVRQFLNSAVSSLKISEDGIDKCNPNEQVCTAKIGVICASETSMTVTVQSLLETKRISENDNSARYILAAKEKYCDLFRSIPSPSIFPCDPFIETCPTPSQPPQSL